MRAILAIFWVTIFQSVSFGETAGVPTQLGARDTSTTNLGAAYSAPNPSLKTGLLGKKSIAIYNGTSSAIAIGVRSNTCSSDTVDNFMIPATTGLVVENVAVAKSICARSLSGSSISSGTIYTGTW